ncbi:MAG: DUF3990 domain-containing protein [Bacteroidales bacterium]|nr:DUF3990 domain-containing protein [Bacteroidales bacterium]
MRLYHGTYTDFDVIDLSKSNKGKDFGKGFYLSDNYEQAYKLAMFKALQFKAAPVVLPYQFEEDLLMDGTLSFLRFDTYSKEWAEFILKNRTNDQDINVHSYDVVYGPIANDKVGIQVRNLLEHNINMEVFLERLKYMHGVTFQYFFGTEKAISKLVRI